MPRAVYIDENTLKVDNIIVVGNTLPTPPIGFTLIREADWAADQNPKIGDIYQGDLPATFVTPAPVDGGDLTDKTPAELLEVAMARLADTNAVIAEIGRQLGG